MAKRQFSSTDTSVWLERYGNSTDGVYQPVSTTDILQAQAVTGSAGVSSLSGSNAGFSNGDLLLVWQSTGTGIGSWELNKILAASSFSLTYPLINNYATGAQAIKLKQYSSAIINTGVTINGQAWNGSVGGIYVLLVNGGLTINGTLNLTAAGFRGASAVGGGHNTGFTGEGQFGFNGQTSTNNGMGAGGGGHASNGPWTEGAGGGGGSGGWLAGNSGFWNGGANIATPGSGGATVWFTTALIMGGGGGGGGTDDAQFGNRGFAGGFGGNGGMTFLIIAKYISFGGSGSIQTGGQFGQNGLDGSVGAGGSGGAGNGILKGITLALGTNQITALGALGQQNSYSNGGTGGNGLIHADYLVTPTGTTNPGLDSTFDPVLQDPSPIIALF